MASPTINLNDSLPAPPAGGVAVKWQSAASVHSGGVVNVSAYIPSSAISGGLPTMNGQLHSLWFNNSTTLDYSNTKPSNGASSFWSHLGGTFAVNNNTSVSGKPSYYKLVASSGNASLAEDGIGAQGCWNIFQGYSIFAALDDNTSDQVIWLAMSSALYGTIGANASPACTIFGFRFKRGTDTNWQAYVGTASGTDTVVDTGVTPDNNFHQFAFFRNSTGGIDFYIDGAKVVTIASSATGFPASTTAVYCVMNVNSATSNTQLDLAGVNWWSD